LFFVGKRALWLPDGGGVTHLLERFIDLRLQVTHLSFVFMLGFTTLQSGFSFEADPFSHGESIDESAVSIALKGNDEMQSWVKSRRK